MPIHEGVLAVFLVLFIVLCFFKKQSGTLLVWPRFQPVPPTLANLRSLQEKSCPIAGLGLADFVFGIVNSVLNSPDGQVNFWGKFKLQKDCNQSC